MLAKVFRINTPRDYKRVEKGGVITQYNTFGIAVLDRKDENVSRFGFVVSTKISKSAVDRNLFKRTMREAVRVNLYRAKKGFDIVFLGKPTLIKTPTSDVMKEVQKALEERGLVN